MTDPPSLLLAGEIGKPHGIRGEVYVLSVSDDPHRWDPGSLLVRPDGRDLTVSSSRPHKGTRLLVKFEGVDSRDDAEKLRGPLYVPSERLRKLDSDEYFHHDLVGATVFDRGGTEIGEIRDVIQGAAQDLLVVERNGGEVLVPLVKAIVEEVDVGAGRVVVDPPEGLFE